MLAPSSDRILVELFQILKDDAVKSAALNMQYASSRQQGSSLKAKMGRTTDKDWPEFQKMILIGP